MTRKALKSYILIAVYFTTQLGSMAPVSAQQIEPQSNTDSESVFPWNPLSFLPDFLNPNKTSETAPIATEPSKATLPLRCSITEQGWEVPELVAFTEDDTKLFEDIEAIGLRSKKTREAIFIRTNTKVQVNEIEVLKNDLLVLKNKIEKRIQITKRDGSHEHSIVESYLQAAQSVLLLDLLNARQQSPFKIAEAYGLLINANSYEMLFSTEFRKLYGISISEKGDKYLIAFSNSTVLSLYLRALARSEKALKNPKESMLMAIQCALGMTHIQKAMHHAELLGESNLNLNLKDNDLLCEGIDLKTAKAVTAWDILALREDTYRQFGYEEIPTVFEKFDESAKNVIMSQPILAAILPELIMSAHNTDDILTLHKMNKKDLTFNTDKKTESKDSVKVAIDLDTFVKNVIASSNSIYQDPDFKNIQNAFTPSVSAIMFPYINSCGTTIDKDISNHEKIVQIDNYLLPLKIQSQLRHFKVRLLSLSDESKVKTVENLIRWARYDSIYAAYSLVIDYLRDPKSPEALDIIFASRGIIDPILESNIHSATVQKSINNLAQRIVKKMSSEYSEIMSADKIRKPLITAATKVSKQLEENLNPKRDPKTLPYMQAAIERSIENRLNELSGIYKTFMSAIIEKQNYFKQKELWNGVKQRLNKTKEELNVYCSEVGYVEGAKKTVTGVVSEKTKVAYEFQKQCRALTLYAHVTGLEENNRPIRLGDYWSTLEKIYSKSDLEGWLDVYRKELEYESYKSAPILAAQGLRTSLVGKSLRFLGFDGTPLWKKLNKTSDETEKDQLLKSTLKDSLFVLSESLQEIINAKKLEDMSTLFKRTQTLKVIFGGSEETKDYVAALGLKEFDASNIDQLSLSRGVMTAQQKIHDDEQNLYYRTERIQSEIFTDFLSNYLMIGFGFLGAQILRFGSRFFPYALGGSTIHAILDTALLRTGGILTAHSLTFTGLLVTQIGIAQLEKYNFRTELKNIRELYQTETPGLRNALPLMTFQEFTRQRHFAFHMVDELTSIQKWNSFFLLLPLIINYGSNVTDMFKGKFRARREIKLNEMDVASRISLETKILKFAAKQQRLLEPDMKRLGVTRLSLSEMQANLDNIRRNAKRARLEMFDEVKLAEESYNRIVYEIGKEVDSLLAHPLTLNVYRSGLSKGDLSHYELTQFHAEYLKIYASWFIQAGNQ